MAAMTNLSWAALNRALLECADQAVLQRWLEDEVTGRRRTRALRIYGRFSAVRRAQELRELDGRLRRRVA
jgi:hypothetical protein